MLRIFVFVKNMEVKALCEKFVELRTNLKEFRVV